MEGSAEFLAKLEPAFEARRTWLQERRAPQLKEALRTFLQHYRSLLELLTRKGLIRDDPYDYEQATAEIAIPADDAMLETERRDQLSRRLDGLRQQVDYLISEGRFSPDDLEPVRLKRFATLISYLSWGSLSEQSTSPTGRAVAQIVNGLRMGGDRVIAVVTKDTVNQLAAAQGRILTMLAELAAFHRERWKLDVRRNVLPRLGLTREKAAQREELMRSVRKHYVATMPNQPFFLELFDEILAEELADDAEAKRAALLARLAERDEPSAPVHRELARPDRQALLDAVRHMSRAQREIASALDTVRANASRATGAGRGLGGIIRRLLEALAGQRRSHRVLEVEYPEGDGAAVHRESINLASFLEAGRRRVELLASLTDESGATFARFVAAPDPQLLEWVEKQLVELFLLHRRLAAVNARLAAETPVERRGEIKGIRLELAAIKNALIKASQRKHEYTSRLEELEQLQPPRLAGSGPG